MTMTLREQHETETNSILHREREKKKGLSKPVNDGKQHKFTIYKGIFFVSTLPTIL